MIIQLNFRYCTVRLKTIVFCLLAFLIYLYSFFKQYAHHQRLLGHYSFV